MAVASVVICFLSAASSSTYLFLAVASSLFSVSASAADRFLSATSDGGEEVVGSGG